MIDVESLSASAPRSSSNYRRAPVTDLVRSKSAGALVRRRRITIANDATGPLVCAPAADGDVECVRREGSSAHEAENALLDSAAPAPRVVAIYMPPAEPLPITPPVEPATPVRPPTRVRRPSRSPRRSLRRTSQSKARSGHGGSVTHHDASARSEAQTVTAIRDLLGRAARDLSRVNAGSLNSDGRAQYDQASRFIQQAEDALKSRNIVFAGKLADKAVTMAAVLVR